MFLINASDFETNLSKTYQKHIYATVQTSVASNIFNSELQK